MQVLVAGGTGYIGTELCGELADRGHDVTALARDPDPGGVPSGVDVATGDVTDPASLDAVVGQDAVVNLVALTPLYTPRGGERMHDVVHRGGTEHLVAAAEDAGVDRFVQMSAIDADPDAPVKSLRAKGAAEEIVRNSSLDWVITRPSVVFGEGGEFVPFVRKLTPPLMAPLPGGGNQMRFQPIWLQEFAPMLADCVEDDDRGGETYEFGGPEKLTLAEVAKLVRPSTNVVPLPFALARVGLTVMGAVPGFPMGPEQYRSLRYDNTTDENAVSEFGVDEDDLLTLREFLARR